MVLGNILLTLQTSPRCHLSELKRLDSVSRSPIFSHFGASLEGTSTIRAFRAQFMFIRDNEKRVDYNLQVRVGRGEVREARKKGRMPGRLVLFVINDSRVRWDKWRGGTRHVMPTSVAFVSKLIAPRLGAVSHHGSPFHSLFLPLPRPF